MPPVELTADQEKLRDRIQADLSRIYELSRDRGGQGKPDEMSALFDQMAGNAHALHVELRDAGQEPVHHAYMLKNRGVPPDTVEFYRHVHPVEDLLKFLQDPHANVDPEDVTIGAEFQFRVYSRRWGHDDVYRMKRTKTGWDVRYIAIGGVCDKGGRPYLIENLEHDSIDYPAGLAGWLEWLWLRAKEDGLSQEAVQQALNDLSEWVKQVEHSSPRGGVWEGYK